MKLPRDLSGKDLVKALERLGYAVVRQKGTSHCYLTHIASGHHVAIPLHDWLKIGTLSGILGDVAEHLDTTKEELVERLFG